MSWHSWKSCAFKSVDIFASSFLDHCCTPAPGILVQSDWLCSALPYVVRRQKIKPRSNAWIGAQPIGQSRRSSLCRARESMMGVVVACFRLLHCQFSFPGSCILLRVHIGSSRFPKIEIMAAVYQKVLANETITFPINQLLTAQTRVQRSLAFRAAGNA